MKKTQSLRRLKINKWGSVNEVGGGIRTKNKNVPSIKHLRVILYNSSLEIYV